MSVSTAAFFEHVDFFIDYRKTIHEISDETIRTNRIDLKKNEITVLGKGKKKRVLPLNDEMRMILTEWLALRDKVKGSDTTNALFVSKKGYRLAIRTMEDNLKKILERVTFSVPFNITCHTLRHTFASHLNDNGEDILVIQSLLGHASPRSAQIYIHPSEKRVREAIENLPGVIFINQLMQDGVLNFNFQSKQHPQME